MSYAPLNKAIAALGETTTSMNTPLAGASRLAEGTHTVVIQAVDFSKLDEFGFITLQLLGDTGAFVDMRLYLLDFARERLNYRFIQLLNSLFMTTDAVPTFKKIYDTDPALAFTSLRGLTTTAIVSMSRGAAITSDGVNFVVEFEGTSVRVATMKDAYAELEERGWKRSYTNVDQFTHPAKEITDGNWNNFLSSSKQGELPDINTPVISTTQSRSSYYRERAAKRPE